MRCVLLAAGLVALFFAVSFVSANDREQLNVTVGFSKSSYTSSTVVLERSGEGLYRKIHIIVTLSDGAMSIVIFPLNGVEVIHTIEISEYELANGIMATLSTDDPNVDWGIKECTIKKL